MPVAVDPGHDEQCGRPQMVVRSVGQAGPEAPGREAGPMKYWMLTLVVAGLSAPATAQCTSFEVERMVPVRKSIEGWQELKSISLAMPFTRKLQSDLCNTVV